MYSLLEGNLYVALFSQHGRRGGQRGGSRRGAAEDSRRAAAQWRRDGAQLRGFAGAGQFVPFNVATARNKGDVADDTALGAAIDAAATCDGVLAWTPKLNVFPMKARKSRTSAHHDSVFVTNGIAKTNYFRALLKAGGVFVVFVGGIAVLQIDTQIDGPVLLLGGYIGLGGGDPKDPDRAITTHMGTGPGVTFLFDGRSDIKLAQLAVHVATAMEPAVRASCATTGAPDSDVLPMKELADLPPTKSRQTAMNGGAAAGNVPTTQQHAKHARSLSLCRSCSIITAEEKPLWSYVGKHAARVVVRISPPHPKKTRNVRLCSSFPLGHAHCIRRARRSLVLASPVSKTPTQRRSTRRSRPPCVRMATSTARRSRR